MLNVTSLVLIYVIIGSLYLFLRLPRWLSGKECACQCRSCRRRGFDPRVRKIPWRRKWQPTPVFLPGESHGQRSLVGYRPQGCKELDTTERLSTHTGQDKTFFVPSSSSPSSYHLPLVATTMTCFSMNVFVCF